MFLDSILEDEADICDLLQYVLSKQYLNDCPVPRTREKYDLVQLFDMCDDNFKQAVRTTKACFIWLLDQIYLHPTFYSNSHQTQLPISQQLALTLEWLGSNSNGALVRQFSHNLSIGQRTVVKVSQQVIQAINIFDVQFIVWPDKE